MLLPRLSRSPVASAIGGSLIFFIVMTWWARHISWRDPGSVFFDQLAAYKPIYSDVRLGQAERFLDTAADAPFLRDTALGSENISLCVGVASIARNGVRYLRTTTASLLEGLTREERNEIYSIVFLAETNPEDHPAYHESWLRNLADEVLLYDLPKEKMDHFKDLEEHTQLVSEKMLFDYMYLMKACHKTGAPYISLFEDDVVAMDGWYHRTISGLELAERKTAKEDQDPGNFLYMRLFHTELYLGWNSEDMIGHIFWSLVVVALIGASLIGIRSYSQILAPYLSNRNILIVCCVHTPLLIILYFATGRVSTLPLAEGVNRMNNYGCCAQGLTFPRHKAEELISWYDAEPRIGLRDSLIEKYADERGEQRFALTPSVIQHIGVKTSKVAGAGVQTRPLWSFPFELNDASALRAEHSLAVSSS